MSTMLTRRSFALALGAALAGCQEQEIILPQVSLPGLEGLRSRNGWPVPGIDPGTFRNRVTVLNVWASWCGYCRSEHGLLKELSNDDRFTLIGLLYRDTPQKALAYLREAGNPYEALAVDSSRALTRVLGQRGVPATYVVNRQGKVIARIRGAMSRETVQGVILPAVVAA